MNPSILKRERRRLTNELAAADNHIYDREHTLREIDIHLRDHFAGRIGWMHWQALDQLGGLTGNDTDQDNGRYPISIIRNLRHHRAVLHQELHHLRAHQHTRQLDLDSLNTTLPGFESVAAEREAAELTQTILRPIPTGSPANHTPLFAPLTQRSLF